MVPKTPKQLTFHELRMRTGRGGPRPNAGPKAKPGAPIHHVKRAPLPSNCPAHVTLKDVTFRLRSSGVALFDPYAADFTSVEAKAHGYETLRVPVDSHDDRVTVRLERQD